MTLDYNSLLLALGVSAACLAVTLIGSWFSRRAETFLLTCTAGLVALVLGIFVYSAYVAMPGRILGTLNYLCFLVGFSIIWGAACQFRTGRLPRMATVCVLVTALAVTVPPMALGYDGLAFMLENIVIAILLVMAAVQYWMARREAYVPLLGISVLYCLTAISFSLCAGVLIWNGKLVLGAAPDNWAENLNIAVCIAGMTGIGAMSLALQQSRLATYHRQEAITDLLTGLLNRRALFDLYGQRQFKPNMAVVVFDIDRFKSVNDQHGHAAGDRTLKVFANTLLQNSRPSDTVGRLGGEEFALVLNDILPGRAEMIAERVRRSFEVCEIVLDDRQLQCTTSAGVAFGTKDGMDFDAILNAADKALYTAKRNGRNRVEIASYLHSITPESSRTAS